MTDVDNQKDDLLEDQVEDKQLTRLELLKQRANAMGIKHSPNIGEEALADKIDKHLAGRGEDNHKDYDKETQGLTASGAIKNNKVVNPRERAFKLERVIIYPVDPRRAQLTGELVFAGNSEIGIVGKYVPFNDKRGYHVPSIHMNKLRETQFTEFYTVQDQWGNDETKTRQRSAYIIQTLPPLTEAELEAIATRQKGLPVENEE